MIDLAEILENMRNAGQQRKGTAIGDVKFAPRRDGRMSLVVHSRDGSAIWSVEGVQAAMAYLHAWIESAQT